MRRGAIRSAWVVGAVCLAFAGSARAHDPDWKPEAGEEPPAPAPAKPSPQPRVQEEKWPDPFAEERRWGPVHVGVGAGYFQPWQGDGGHAVNGHVLVSSPTGHFRLGGELLYRSYESRIFDVNDVDVDSYDVHFVFHYLFFPEGITPYLGAGIGFQINKIRKTEVQGARPGTRVTDDVGAGFGLTALAGLEVPATEHVAFFAEARANLAYQQTSEDDDHRRHGYHDHYDHYDSEDLGGALGLIGVRYRF